MGVEIELAGTLSDVVRAKDKFPFNVIVKKGHGKQTMQFIVSRCPKDCVQFISKFNILWTVHRDIFVK
jgi:hypothetical protein